MIVPEKSSGGTSTETLAEDAKDALEHLRKGLRAIRQMWPNGRDYYSAESLQKARDHFDLLVESQESVIREIETYLEGVMDR